MKSWWVFIDLLKSRGMGVSMGRESKKSIATAWLFYTACAWNICKKTTGFQLHGCRCHLDFLDHLCRCPCRVRQISSIKTNLLHRVLSGPLFTCALHLPCFSTQNHWAQMSLLSFLIVSEAALYWVRPMVHLTKFVSCSLNVSCY